MRKLRIWLARLFLRGTGRMIVPRVEVERVYALCTELQEYAQRSGGINAPHRINAARKVRNYTQRIAETTNEFWREP